MLLGLYVTGLTAVFNDDTLLLGAYYEAPFWVLIVADGQTTVCSHVTSR